jgi:hypothetical protein
LREDPKINETAFSYALEDPQFMVARFNIYVMGLHPEDRVQGAYRDHRIQLHEGV